LEVALSANQLHAVAEPADNSATVAELKKSLSAVAQERDQLRAAAGEKAELLKRIDGLSRERDDFVSRAGALSAERDALLRDSAALKSALEAASRRAETAEGDRARLLTALDAKAEYDPLFLLWQVISQKTKQGVAFVRGKIPPEHPALPWFDKTIETVTQLGCLAVRGSIALISWATPRAKALAERLWSEAQTRLAKK